MIAIDFAEKFAAFPDDQSSESMEDPIEEEIEEEIEEDPARSEDEEQLEHTEDASKKYELLNPDIALDYEAIVRYHIASSVFQCVFNAQL